MTRKNYKVVSISLYDEDLERLKELTEQAKIRKGARWNKSMLIRYALQLVDVRTLPELEPKPSIKSRGIAALFPNEKG